MSVSPRAEVLQQLDPTDRTMLAQVGRPWLAAVLASGLPRLPRGVTVRLGLWEFCMSVERLAWAKANGCWWGVPNYDGSNNTCALAAEGGYLAVLRGAREHHCPWNAATCEAQLGEGTWRCCGGRGSTTVRGARTRVLPLRAKGTWMC